MMQPLDIVYFSNVSNNTHRFVNRLSLEGNLTRIPLKGEFGDTIVRPFILVTPTYTDQGVPPQVRSFLKEAERRKMMVGVIASGNTNFGEAYAKAGYAIQKKCRVPLLYTFEILGTQEDVKRVEEGIRNYHVG